ncbi:MAG: hypothetical protein MRY63_01300 [Neomegalonema sp.]|nr:hypothetical protein [Neomegalonema sp.]
MGALPLGGKLQRGGLAALVLAASLLCGAMFGEAHAQAQLPAQPLISLPTSLFKDCLNGRAKIYDQCTDQGAIFAAARARAQAEDKVLLVAFGAEWCVWCHIFDAYIRGEHGSFHYTVEGEAVAMSEAEQAAQAQEAAGLASFAAERFVLAHIEGHKAPGGQAVLEQAGAAPFFDDWIPFIFAVDREGQYVGHVLASQVNTRIDGPDGKPVFQGYDRAALRLALQELHDAAREGGWD